MKTKFHYLLLSVFLITVFSSCRKDIAEPKAPQASMKDIAVPENFDWKTTKDFTLNLTATSTGLLEITNSEDIAYLRIFLTAGKPYSGELNLPSYETKVRLKFHGKSEEIEIFSQNISFHFD